MDRLELRVTIAGGFEDAQRVLAHACAGPWGGPERQSFGVGEWGAFDRGACEAQLVGPRALVEVAGPGWSAGLSNNARRSAMTWFLDPWRVPSADLVGELLHAMADAAGTYESAWASADDAVSQWYDAQALPSLSRRFGLFVRWMHLLPPPLGATAADRVRATEGVTVRTFGDGRVLLQSFDDPFAFADPATRTRLRALSEALWPVGR